MAITSTKWHMSKRIRKTWRSSGHDVVVSLQSYAFERKLPGHKSTTIDNIITIRILSQLNKKPIK